MSKGTRNIEDMEHEGVLGRVLFDFKNFRLMDKVIDEPETYFIVDFNSNDAYRITLKEAYDFMALYLTNEHKILQNQLREFILKQFDLVE